MVKNRIDNKEKMDAMFDSIRNGVESMFASDRYQEYLDFIRAFYRYSYHNIMLIKVQNPDATMVASYKMWQERERKCKAGESIKILVPTWRKYVKTDQGIVYQKNYTDKIKSDLKNGVLQENKALKFQIGDVWDVGSTYGKDIPSLISPLTADQDSERIFGEIYEMIGKEIPIRFEDMKAKGYYNWKTQTIALNTQNNSKQNLKTLIHEYAHYKLHDPKKEKPMENLTESEKDQMREIQAESVAYIVCKHLGIDTSDYSFGYVAGWSKGKDTEMLVAAGTIIKDTAGELIEQIENHLGLNVESERDVELMR